MLANFSILNINISIKYQTCLSHVYGLSTVRWDFLKSTTIYVMSLTMWWSSFIVSVACGASGLRALHPTPCPACAGEYIVPSKKKRWGTHFNYSAPVAVLPKTNKQQWMIERKKSCCLHALRSSLLASFWLPCHATQIRSYCHTIPQFHKAALHRGILGVFCRVKSNQIHRWNLLSFGNRMCM